MKTKIIYISGSEVFDMADVRSAFEEVRAALGLGTDTVLFGVPVDSDDALGKTADTTETPDVLPADVAVIAPEPIAEPQPEPEIVPDVPATPEPVVTEKPKRKPRARKSVVTDDGPDATPAVPDAPTVAEPEPTPAPVVSILSVLKSKSDDAPDTDESDAQSATAPVQVSDTPNDTAPEISEPVMTATTETVTIADIATDDVPDAPVEKTLEQLLESMTPLREDHNEFAPDADVTELEPQDDDIITPDANNDDTGASDDTDATLEQLATEFAENQDKIPTAPKAERGGKIGKLKNILPFKKARRDDTGLMGDLFGWAGIAANDDDFSMPGFFTGVASKK